MTKTTKTEKKPEDYISPLNINGLEGRMLHLPAPSKDKDSEILIIYGHHSNIERWWGFAMVFNKYAAVTMPDLPGFGGMDSLYKINRVPNLDELADYLATFVKMRYSRKKVTLVGLSFGFLVATRMLQRHPQLTKKVTMLVSAVGFAHHDDFKFSPQRKKVYRIGSRVIANPVVAKIFRATALNPVLLRTIYSRTHNAKHKFAGVTDKEHFRRMMDAEVVLWHCNDVRTHWKTTLEMLTVDNCQKQVRLPVWHVATSSDQYFHNDLVEQHLRIIFDGYHYAPIEGLKHTPSVVAEIEEFEPFVPDLFRKAYVEQHMKKVDTK